MKTAITDPESFFNGLGGLHDSLLERITWDANQSALSIQVDDIHANFEGLGDDPGRQPATLTFSSVEGISLQCDAVMSDTQMIYKLTAKTEAGTNRLLATLHISPCGEIQFTFGLLHLDRG